MRNKLIAAGIALLSQNAFSQGYEMSWDQNALKLCEDWRAEEASQRTGGPYKVQTKVMIYTNPQWGASVRCWLYIPAGLEDGRDWGIGTVDFGLGQEIPPLDKNECGAGNPIRISSGVKTQTEPVINSEHIPFTWIYRSPLLGWQHNYAYELSWTPLIEVSASGQTMKMSYPSSWRTGAWTLLSTFKKLVPDTNDPDIDNNLMLAVKFPNGKIYRFQPLMSPFEIHDSGATLNQINNSDWVFRLNGQQLIFNNLFQLKSVSHNHGMLNISVLEDSNQLILETKDTRLIATKQKGKISSISVNEVPRATFSWTQVGQLESIHHLSTNTSRSYLYTKENFPDHLTGIIDEAGIRSNTWDYDSEGRGILSYHGANADRYSLSYTDNSTTVTNPLNKSTTYHYQVTQGRRLLTTVQGHPSDNCAAANKAYTYYDNGTLKTKTDWQGRITEYIRDDYGREIERTEAKGTPDARVIKTVWHPTLNVKTKVIEPKTTTEWEYFDDGKLKSSTTYATAN